MKNKQFANRKPHSKTQNIKSGTGKTKKVFAKKSFGQNFLIDENYIERIIIALDLQVGETIVEIGAGRGALTEKLIDSGANVVAVELERGMISVLREEFGDYENFKLIESDALKVNFAELTDTLNPSKIKLVANLPFNISTAILQKLFEQREVFSRMILMFQREVVDRITARVGSSERGFLTVLTDLYLKTEKLFDVPPDAFLPAPKVWSSVVRLIPKPETEINLSDEHLFRHIVSAGFAQKRKTILNNFKNLPPNLQKIFPDINLLLNNCAIDAQRRAETLTLNEWKCLAEYARITRDRINL